MRSALLILLALLTSTTAAKTAMLGSVVSQVKRALIFVGIAGLCMGAANSPSRLAILVLPAPGMGIPASEVYLACRRAIEKDTAFRVAGLDTFSKSLEEEAVRECAGDSQCFARKLSDSGSQADWLLTVAMDRLGDDIALGLRLINIEQALRSGGGEKVVSDVLPGSSAPIRATTDLLPRVFEEQGWGQIGALSVQVAQSGAEILVDDNICVSPCRMERLPVGTHRVTVQKRGYETWTKNIEVKTGSMENISVSLKSTGTPTDLSTVLMWTGVGLGVVGAGFVTWFIAQPSDTVNVCIAADAAQCGM